MNGIYVRDLCEQHGLKALRSKDGISFGFLFTKECVYTVPWKYVTMDWRGRHLVYSKQAGEVITAVNLVRCFS